MRVVFLNPTGHYGGAEAALVELLVGLAHTGPAWSLSVVAASEGAFVDRVRALGVPVAVVPFPASVARLGEWASGGSLAARLRFLAACLRAVPDLWHYRSRLRDVVQECGPQIVHSNGAKMHLLATMVAPRTASVVWHVHDYVGQRFLSSRLLSRLAHRVTAVVANSESVATELRRLFGSTVPVHRVWNAVDLDRFAPDGPSLDLDELAGLTPAAAVCRVGLVATFARWKGHTTFLRALGSLTDLPVRGYIIGGPVYVTDDSQVTRAELSEVAGAAGLGDRVGFVGHVPESAQAMRALDVVVHASTQPEPFGLVIAEGMACGRAVVVSAAGGAAELIEPGVTALAHAPGDVKGLAAALRAVVSSPALREQLGAAARAAAERSFSRARMVREMVQVYRSAVPEEVAASLVNATQPRETGWH